MIKRVDRDKVPEILIVKHIELMIEPKSNVYVLYNKSDSVYFE